MAQRSNVERLAGMTIGYIHTFAVLLILYWIWIAFSGGPARDDTDSATQRSGMALYTDHGTGCQYLGRDGALTPRRMPDGRQFCGPVR